MRSHRDDLGTSVPSVVALVTVFFFAPVFVYVVRRKWRLAIAKKDEIERLVMYASQEAARAEFEYQLVYKTELESTGGVSFCGASVSGGDRLVRACAVCYNPTTTRCSRCKAVRYCSGKCQIIHWRQGHKDECHSKPTDVKDDTPGVSHDLTAASTAEYKYFDDGSENIVTRHVEEGTKDDMMTHLGDAEKRNHVDIPGTDRNGPSPVLSSNSSPQMLDTSSASVKHVASHTIECNSHSSCGTTSIRSNKMVKHFEVVHSNHPPPEIVVKSVHVSSPVDNLNQQAAGVEVPSHELDGDHDSFGFGNSKNVPVSTHHGGRFDLSMNRSSKRDANPQEDPKTNPILAFPTQSCSAEQSCGNVSLPESKDFCGRTKGEILRNPRESKVSPDVSTSTSARSCQGNNVPGGKCITVSTHPMKSPASTTASNGGQAVKSPVENADQLKPSKSSKPHNSHPSYDLYLKLYNEKVELQPHGLVNCGNSCYANAVLQCLTFTRPLTAYFLLGLHSKKCSKKEWCFTCELQNLIVRADQGESPLSPIGILSQVNNLSSSLGHGKEEDAHEFLRCAIEAMQKDCVRESVNSKGVHSDEATLMQLIFGGYLRSKIRCLKCQGTSERCEKILDLTVEIGSDDIQSLEQALARFTNYELLDGENKYKCNRCKSYEKAKKRLTVLEAPNVLTIALKRFQSGKFGKLNKAVLFPEVLNMTKYMSSTSNDKSPVYRLYAVVVHVDLMFSGHYICYVKSTNDKWYEIDDSTVKPVEIEKVLSKGAYMLLYARISPHRPSLICNTLPFNVRNYSEGYHTTTGTGREKYVPKLRMSPVQTLDSVANHNIDFHGGRLFQQHAYASSESSSLTSLSDDSSVSTESTRDSTSADEYSDFFNGEPGCRSSPLRLSEESYGFITRTRQNEMGFASNSNSSSDLSSLGEEESHQARVLSHGNASGTNRVEKWQHHENRHVGKGSPILLSDTAMQCRKLTEHCSSSGGGISRATVWDNNPCKKSGLFMRKTTREGCIQERQ